VARSYHLALAFLRYTPEQFWRLTPSETADLVIARREQINADSLRRAWELSYLLAPHAKEGSEHEIGPMALFQKMPGVFMDDLPLEFRQKASRLSPAQEAERKRRQNIKRVTRP
jgi:uncharacterized phage protein (TIGR02216 family)